MPDARRQCSTDREKKMNKTLIRLSLALAVSFAVQGCTVLAIADAAGSAVVYGAKTAVNVLDAITPDIINKD